MSNRRVSLVFRSAFRRLPKMLRRVFGRRCRDCKKTHLEVERKFKISSEEFRALSARLLSQGFQLTGQVFMTDTFLPVQVEGDMMRIRVETMNDITKTILTRKQWVTVGGERERQETERDTNDLAAGCLLELGERLAGGPLPSFSKDRDMYSRLAEDEHHQIVVALDTAEGLGEYSGHYMEIELLVPVDGDVQAARQQIASLAASLLGEERAFEQMSYQDMLKRSMR
jgi:adenylate cyclase class IV